MKWVLVSELAGEDWSENSSAEVDLPHQGIEQRNIFACEG